jgi:hypothetical protein
MRDRLIQHQPAPSLCDLLDRLLETGVVVLGEAKLTVADFDLVYVGLKLVVTSVEQGRDRGLELLPRACAPRDDQSAAAVGPGVPRAGPPHPSRCRGRRAPRTRRRRAPLSGRGGGDGRGS